MLVGYLALNLVFAALAPAVTKQDQTCAVVAQVLSDIRTVTQATPRKEDYFDPVGKDIDKDSGCPNPRLPDGMTLATDEIRARVQPIVSPHPVTIFYVGRPIFDKEQQRARVSFGYRCNGPCAAFFKAVYYRSGSEWKREGNPELEYVS